MDGYLDATSLNNRLLQIELSSEMKWNEWNDWSYLEVIELLMQVKRKKQIQQHI